jgi:ferredoxin
MHGEEALIYTPNPDDTHRDQVLSAAAACPTQAILVQRDNSPIGEGEGHAL